MNPVIETYFSPKTPSFRAGIQGRFSKFFLAVNVKKWYAFTIYRAEHYDFGNLAVGSAHQS